MTSWRRWRTSLILFLAVLGPGFITANVDNDAGGILTYSQAGAQFGYTLLWTMIPITLALIVVQEMCARMGVVTGKGLSDLIREEFGLRMTFLMHDPAGHRQLRQRHRRVLRHRRQHAALPHQQIRQRPRLRRSRLDARRQGRLQERRKSLPHRQRLLHRLHRRRCAQRPRLAPRPGRDRQAARRAASGTTSSTST